MSLSKQFDELAGHLPEQLPTRKQQLQTLVELQQQMLSGRQALLDEVAAAGTDLARFQLVYGELADDKLRLSDRRSLF